jgi:prepilin-type N-terminal cleavage/methylation domain-containing protein
MMKKHRGVTRKGFTLLELLVVISIIGILVALGAVAFSTAQKKGRDAKRRGDMKAVQNAFEQYYAQNNTYALNCETMWTGTQSTGSLPTDPVPTKSYSLSCLSATTYCACAWLDETGTGNAADASCTFGAGDYFCVTNLQ